jgi:hypothetical protein
MASAPQPVFTGAPGEDVDHFIDRCELYYVTAGLTTALQEANAVMLREGCQGMARECIQKVPRANRKDFGVLTQALRDSFPYKEEGEDESAILNRIMNLKQGNKKLDDYINEGIRLKCEISSEFQHLLAEQWVSGLQNQATVTGIRITMHQRKKEGKCNIDNVTKLVRYVHGEGISSNNPPPLSTEERMNQTLKELSQAIASSSLGGSQTMRSRPTSLDASQRGRFDRY